jgi:acetyltransferase-like isoleucine patch superfamily enzyme
MQEIPVDSAAASKRSDPERANGLQPNKIFLRKALGGSLEEKVERALRVYWILRTYLLFRWRFHSLGTFSFIRKPILLKGKRFIRIGNRVSIRDGVRIEALQTSPNREPLLEIGNNTNIEQFVHIICHSHIRIGDNVSITGKCAIVDVNHPYENIEDVTKIGVRIRDEDSFVTIGDGTFLGYGAVVLPNVRIGRHCVIGANSVVSRDVPDYTVVAGIPARPIRTFSKALNCWIACEA